PLKRCRGGAAVAPGDEVWVGAPPGGCAGGGPPPPRAGIRSWDIDLASCNLDEQLKLFVSRHSATFSSIVKGGSRGQEGGEGGEEGGEG
uniref:Microtubule-associated protein 1B/S N-terminal domain-containing protein n=1 Tax=Anas platyrhynchos platyrhynchos TaxID=8840 RepID=A0A493SZ86_ANAPP